MLAWMFGKDELASEKIEANVQAKLKVLTEKANAGDIESQLELANIYEGLEGVARNYAESRKWATAAANQNSSRGWYFLGTYHEHGLGGEKDTAQAEACFRKALELARNLEKDEDPSALHTLGHLHLHGEVVGKSAVKALEYYKRSAEKGYAAAQYSVGYLLDYDYSQDGIKRNSKEAQRYYTLAAAQGCVRAQYELGHLFHHGREDFEINHTQAREHYVFPASRGCAKAQAGLGYIYFYGRGIAQDRKKGIRLLNLAAEQGYDNAQYAMGCAYKDGDGVSRNFITARGYFEKAAQQGYELAAYALGRMYEIPQGGTQDMASAFRYYKQAAEKDHVEGLYHLGRLYQKGYTTHHGYGGLRADPAKARECFEKAASFGNTQAQQALDRLNGVAQPVATTPSASREQVPGGWARVGDSIVPIPAILGASGHHPVYDRQGQMRR